MAAIDAGPGAARVGIRFACRPDSRAERNPSECHGTPGRFLPSGDDIGAQLEGGGGPVDAPLAQIDPATGTPAAEAR